LREGCGGIREVLRKSTKKVHGESLLRRGKHTVKINMTGSRVQVGRDERETLDKVKDSLMKRKSWSRGPGGTVLLRWEGEPVELRERRRNITMAYYRVKQ